MELAKNVKTHGNNGQNGGTTSNNKRQLFLKQQLSITMRPARDAELILWFPVSDFCTTAFSLVRDTEAGCCHVGGLLPFMIRIACSLSSRLMAAGAADSSTPVGASTLSLLWSSASGSELAPLALCR